MVSANPSLSNWPQTKIPNYLRAFDVMGYDFHGSWFSDALRELLDITTGLFEVNTIRMTSIHRPHTYIMSFIVLLVLLQIHAFYSL